MHRSIHRRFEVVKTLRRSRGAATFVGRDRWSDDDEDVVVRFFAANTYRTPGNLCEKLAWYRGLCHPLVGDLRHAAVTTKRDFYCVRNHYPGSALVGMPSRPIALAAQIVSACSILRSEQIIHGRIRPSNCLVDRDGSLRLVDGGLPTMVAEPPGPTGHFTAPEVVTGNLPTLDADLYSLAAVLYLIYSGRHLFQDSDPARLKEKHLHAVPVPLGEVCDVSAKLSDVISSLLDRRPEARAVAFPELVRLLPMPVQPARQAPLVGRNAQLEEALDALQTSDPGLKVLTLDGEAGSGKTRFIEEMAFRRELAGEHVLVGRSYERGNRQFEPILQIISRWLTRNGDADDWMETEGRPFAGSVGVLLPELGERTEAAEQPIALRKLATDLAGALISLSRRSSTVTIVLEDAHWVDEGTLSVLEQLWLRSGECNLRLALTFRSGQSFRNLRQFIGKDTCLMTISLQPLDRRSSIDLATRLTADASSVSWVVDNGFGNPLSLEECARYSGAASKRLPQQVGDILREKIAQLPRRDRAAAEILSLFPQPVRAGLVHQALETVPSASPQSLQRLVGTGILGEAHGRFAFRHDRIRATIYRGIPNHIKKRLHESICDLLSAEGADIASVAYHAERAGKLSEAADGYLRAAEIVHRQESYQTAAEHYSNARRLAARVSRRLEVKLEMAYARCLRSAGKDQLAKSVLTDLIASEETVDAHTKGEAYRILAYTSRESVTEAVQLYLCALEQLDTNSPDARWPLLGIAQTYALAGKVQSATESLLRVERLPVWHEESDAVALAAKGNILLSLCEYRRALKSFARGGHSDRDVLAISLNNRAVCFEHMGDLSSARRFQKESLELARRFGIVSAELQSYANLAAFSYKKGEFGVAADFFAQVDRASKAMHYHRVGDRTNLPLLNSDQAALQTELGQYARAGTLLTAAARLLRGDRSSQKAVWVALRKAELCGRIGNTAGARNAMDRVMEAELLQTDFFQVEQALITHWMKTPTADHSSLLEAALEKTHAQGTLYQRCRVLIALAEFRIERGQTGRALEHLDAADRLACKHGYRPLRARILLLRGRSASTVVAREKALTQASQIALELPLPEIGAEAAFRTAELLHDRGDPGNAKVKLAESETLITKLAEQVPLRNRNHYLKLGWRKQALTMNNMSNQLDQATQGSLSRRDRHFFKAVYEGSQSLGAVADEAEFRETFTNLVSATLTGQVTLMLNIRDQAEFYAPDDMVDDRLRRKLNRLYERHRFQPFFNDEDASQRDSAERQTTVWVPLTAHGNRFGGIFVELGARRLAESEMEFLSTVGLIGSFSLAALLWAEGRPRTDRSKPRVNGIIGSSREIVEVCRQIEVAAGNAATVLIEGESGTGKELVAKAIHSTSDRHEGPLVTVDCGAIPETLIESELFGSRKGSYTGAISDRPGLIETANGGSLFLDEVGNTSSGLQSKLLRVLQERRVRRLGDSNDRPVDVRLIAATNANLDEMVTEGRFRQDLLFRLKVLHIPLPPLRKRRHDIPEIARALLGELNSTHKARKRFGPNVLGQLSAGNYPGNVRELQNVIERAFFSAETNTIKQVDVSVGTDTADDKDEITALFQNLKQGRADFWKSIHARYKNRDISRERVMALMDMGLRETHGSYKSLARLFQMKGKDYRRFMDFLRRNKCQPDFRPYRRL